MCLLGRLRLNREAKVCSYACRIEMDVLGVEVDNFFSFGMLANGDFSSLGGVKMKYSMMRRESCDQTDGWTNLDDWEEGEELWKYGCA